MHTKLTSNMFQGVFFLSAFALTTMSSGAEWGSIKGRFVLDGAPPKLAPLVVTKDAFCIEKMPVNESVVIGPDGGLANVIVFLRVPRGGKVEVHPDYPAQPKEAAVLDNSGCSFKPHISLVRAGQPLVIKNSDPVGHNTNIAVFAFNQTIPIGSETPLKTTRATPIPMPIVCNIHPWMKAHVLVQDHPYMAVSADDGTFEIKNIPVGKHEFQMWHEGSGYMKNLKYNGGTANRQGRATLTIAAGETLDLGDIKVPASLLK